jgi:hypothetical protein
VDATDRRIDDLEARVTALEAAHARRPTPPPGDGPAADEATDTFWALEGLRRRAPGPGAAMLVGAVTLPDGREAGWQEARTTTDLLEDDWGAYADTLAALAHPVRLRLVHHVLHGTTTVSGLTEAEGSGTAGRTYHHLRQLVAAGWLRSTGSGRYEVPVERVVPLLTTVLGARR